MPKTTKAATRPPVAGTASGSRMLLEQQFQARLPSGASARRNPPLARARETASADGHAQIGGRRAPRARPPCILDSARYRCSSVRQAAHPSRCRPRRACICCAGPLRQSAVEIPGKKSRASAQFMAGTSAGETRPAGKRSEIRRSYRRLPRALPLGRKKRLEDLAQRATPPQDSRFHGPHGNAQHFGHLFVGHSLEVSQNHRRREKPRPRHSAPGARPAAVSRLASISKGEGPESSSSNRHCLPRRGRRWKICCRRWRQAQRRWFNASRTAMR